MFAADVYKRQLYESGGGDADRAAGVGEYPVEHGPRSVSYTQLDVYKRQIYRCGEDFFALGGNVFYLMCGRSFYEKVNWLTGNHNGCSMHDIMFVSSVFVIHGKLCRCV